MIHFLTLYFTALGLSQFFSIALGASFFMGLTAIPLILFLGNVLLGLPLTQLSWVVLGLGALGLALGAWRRQGQWERDLLFHPLFIYPVGVCFFLLIFHPFTYKIGHWDEYSHWLLMPKQIFYANEILSSTFPFPQLVRYTPGHPLFINFTQLLWEKKFTEAHALYPLLLSGIALSTVIFDIARKLIFKERSSSLILSWALILILDLVDLPYRTFEDNVLVEKFLIDLSTFIFLYFILLKKISPKHLVVVALTLVSGFLYKRPMALLALPTFLGLALLAWRERKKSSLLFLLAFVPLILVYKLWTIKTQGYPVDWNLSHERYGSFWQTLCSTSAADIFGRVIKATLVTLLKNPILLLGVLGVYWSKRQKSFALSTGLSLFYFVIYVLGLAWTYLTAFGSYEAAHLASFKRYLTMALAPCATVGILAFFAWAQEKFQTEKSTALITHWGKRMVMLLAVAVIFKATYKCFLPQSAMIKSPDILSQEFPLLVKFIERGSYQNPVVEFIDQRGLNSGQLVNLRYASVVGSAQGARQLFTLVPALASAPEPQGVGIEKISATEFAQRLSTVDILIILHTDPWMEGILKKVLDPSCSGEKMGYIFHRRKGQTVIFDCTLKTELL